MALTVVVYPVRKYKDGLEKMNLILFLRVSLEMRVMERVFEEGVKSLEVTIETAIVMMKVIFNMVVIMVIILEEMVVIFEEIEEILETIVVGIGQGRNPARPPLLVYDN